MRKHANLRKVCRTCCRPSDDPFRTYDPETQEIVEGCIDRDHTFEMSHDPFSKDGQWHFRPVARKLRRDMLAIHPIITLTDLIAELIDEKRELDALCRQLYRDGERGDALEIPGRRLQRQADKARALIEYVVIFGDRYATDDEINEA